MKEGLHFENDELIYYKNGQPYHAGVIKVDGAIYYISSKGRAVKGQHIVHRQMTNDILKRGTYTFGDDYKLVKGSYHAPKKHKKSNKAKVTPPHRKSFRWKKLGRKKLLLICAALGMLVVFSIGLFSLDHLLYGSSSPTTSAQDPTDGTITLPSFAEDVFLCSNFAKREFDGQIALKDAVQSGTPYRAFRFEYEFSRASGTLLLSLQADFTDAEAYDLPQDNNYISIDNLMTETTYYYKVMVAGQEFTGSFRTAKSTRFVSIPGLVNTRDIGGYVNQEGLTIRQGLLIRGVELDGLVNAAYFLKDADIQGMLDTFGFVHEMDLRGSGVYYGQYTSRLGIHHSFYGAPQYGQIFDSLYHDSLRQIFSDLAKPQNYPMYMHCTWGIDRTGTIVFLLQGILNMSQEDIIREYELSGYENPNVVGNGNLNVLISGLEQYEGNTLSEKIVTYLTTVIGVTEDEIASIRNIFLEN